MQEKQANFWLALPGLPVVYLCLLNKIDYFIIVTMLSTQFWNSELQELKPLQN